MSEDNIPTPIDFKEKTRKPGNSVANIAPQRKQRENSAGEKPPKIPLPEIQYTLLDWMADQIVIEGMGQFIRSFKTTEVDRAKGIYELLEIDTQNLAIEVHAKVLEDALLRSMKEFRGQALLYRLPIEKHEKLAKKFIETRHARQIPIPPLFTFEKDKHLIAFNRVPNPAEGLIEFHGSESFARLAPLYTDFINRCSEPLAVRQFFGSLLHPEYHAKQSLHLWGGSNAGKSTFIKLLLNTICGSRGYEPVNFDMADPFRLDGWSGKMALYADEINDGYYSSLEYKRITNSDEQKVNIKNIRAHKQLIKAKLIATSNPCPALPPDNGVTNRLLLSEVLPLESPNNDKESLAKQLAAEIPYILADMEFAFSQLNNQAIKLSPDAHEEALSIYAAPMQALFDRFFVPAPKGRVEVSVFKNLIVKNVTRGISYKEMREFVRQKYRADLNARTKDGRWVTKIKLKPGIIP